MDKTEGLVARLARWFILGIDTVQRRRHHVYEFDKEPQCMLRISRCQSHEERVLSDGATVRRGDPIIEFHYWNERVPLMGPAGPDLAWGLRFYRSACRSLEDLARYLCCTPGFDDIVALRGETAYASSEGLERYRIFFRRMGFDFVVLPPTAGLEKVALFFMNLYVWIIIWVLNPASLRGRMLVRAQRSEMWISRSALLNRYGPAQLQTVGQSLSTDRLADDEHEHSRSLEVSRS